MKPCSHKRSIHLGCSRLHTAIVLNSSHKSQRRSSRNTFDLNQLALRARLHRSARCIRLSQPLSRLCILTQYLSRLQHHMLKAKLLGTLQRSRYRIS